jgi:arabinan endo-1,5-alpha-L-arabinosidase
MKPVRKIVIIFYVWIVILTVLLSACNKDDNTDQPDPYNPAIPDDYSNIADISFSARWGPYNLHDPTIIKGENDYYIFSTDVAYGDNLKCGIMYRKSSDLVHWKFLGWVFDGVPAIPLEFMETHQPGYEQLSIWAPYITKVDDEYRLYYSVPGNNNLKLACIALATSTSLDGPWTDKGIVISCLPQDSYNTIDPAVIIDQENVKQWLTYGSYSAGIFIVELDPQTGKLKNASDKGKLIAFRRYIHDAIEGAETIYVPELGKYFMFVSYDWLEDNYNVRVGRSDSPQGPYLDIFGKDLAATGENWPMITARYSFQHHSGWQGIGHCSLLKDGDQYFFVSQGRLASNKYLMDLHVRKMVFSPDGWPMVSPERYAAVPQTQITSTDITGKWEHIDLAITTSMNIFSKITLNSNGTIGEVSEGSWSYEDDVLVLSFGTEKIYEARVFNEWDWENSNRTIVYTGMTDNGLCCWGKHVGQ